MTGRRAGPHRSVEDLERGWAELLDGLRRLDQAGPDPAPGPSGSAAELAGCPPDAAGDGSPAGGLADVEAGLRALRSELDGWLAFRRPAERKDRGPPPVRC